VAASPVAEARREPWVGWPPVAAAPCPSLRGISWSLPSRVGFTRSQSPRRRSHQTNPGEPGGHDANRPAALAPQRQPLTHALASWRDRRRWWHAVRGPKIPAAGPVQPMYSYRTGVCERCSGTWQRRELRVERSEHDHVLRIDRYARTAVDLDQPGELHDRPARRVEDHPLDVVGISVDPIGTATNDGYLCCRWHVPCVRAREDERLTGASLLPQGSRRARLGSSRAGR